PALVTRISRPFQASAIRSICCRTCWKEETSAGAGIAVPPAFSISAHTDLALPSLISFTATRAPALANSSAIARPIPEPAPVTTARFPSSVMLVPFRPLEFLFSARRPILRRPARQIQCVSLVQRRAISCVAYSLDLRNIRQELQLGHANRLLHPNRILQW